MPIVAFCVIAISAGSAPRKRAAVVRAASSGWYPVSGSPSGWK